MRIKLSNAAEAEIEATADWYDEQTPGLGRKFTQSVRQQLAIIEEHPKAFPEIDRIIRKATLKKFPHSVIYTETDTGILVVSVAHHRRHPNRWRDNLNFPD